MLKLLRCRLLGIKWDEPDLAPPDALPVDRPDAYMRTLISKTGLARRLDIDPRTLNGVLKASGIAPDFIQGARKLFLPSRLEALRRQIGEARR